MPTNCGIEALSQLTELKNISAFTLVHAARDNGLNLFVFKVNDLDDLVKVQRPAIFHQEGHFVYVKKDEPLPKGKFTGYVLGTVGMGRVIGLQEAKFIKGGKNFFTGKNKDGVQEGHGALGTILGVVGAVVGTIVLPGVGTALGTTISGAAGGAIGGAIGGGVGESLSGGNPLVGAALGGLGGEGIGGGITAASAGGGLAGGLPNAVKNFGQGAFNSISHPIASLGAGGNAIASSGVANAASLASGSNLAQSFGNAVGGAVGSGTAQGGFENAALAAGTGNAEGIGGFTLSNFVPNSNFSTSSIPSLASTASKTAAGAGNGFNLGTAASLAGGVGLLGSKAPAYNAPSPGDNYSALNTFIGNTPQGSANNGLSLASTNANTDLVNTSIQDLQKQFTGNNQRTLDTINTAYDNQRQALVHAYAQAGQNLADSSEAQDKVAQLEQKRTNDLTLAQQELQDQALGQAVQVKQQALSSGMQAGQFNQTLAMQLASLTGDQQNLQYAIANNDYQSFQQIMGKLLTMGIPQSVNVTNNGQSSTVTKSGGI